MLCLMAKVFAALERSSSEDGDAMPWHTATRTVMFMPGVRKVGRGIADRIPWCGPDQPGQNQRTMSISPMTDNLRNLDVASVTLWASLPSCAKLIGTGYVSWWKTERQTGRYGSVNLYAADDTPVPIKFPAAGSLGQIVVRIVALPTLWSVPSHYPVKPTPSQIVPLGSGRAFIADFGEPPLALGVKPVDGRRSDWLSSNNLHFVHNCLVHLFWVPLS